MKPFAAILLTGSLVLNAALAYAALTGSARVAEEAATAAAAAAAAEAASNAVRTAGPSPVDPATWSKLQTEDLPTLVARLREAGFPKDVIRAIMGGLVSELFKDRMKALDPNAANRAFWKNGMPDPKILLAQNRLFQEQQKMLRDLLGPDARSDDPMSLARYRSVYGDLAPDKLDAAITIAEEFDRKRNELYYTKGNSTAAERRALDRDQRAALATVLSPGELEEYDFRNSDTGRAMRNDLTSFNPTEEEFRALFKLRQPFDEKYNYNDGLPAQAQMRERNTAQQQLTADIKTLLGPERMAAYEQSTDYSYQRTTQLVARLELPPETATTLWTTQKEFEQRRTDLYRANPTATPEERTQLLTALQQEAITKVTPLLGSDSRVEAYKQNGGNWISNLVPRSRPTGAK